MALKLAYPGRFDRLAILLYLGLGWSGLILYERLITLPPAMVCLLVGGGLLYSVGIIFHLWEKLRFQSTPSCSQHPRATTQPYLGYTSYARRLKLICPALRPRVSHHRTPDLRRRLPEARRRQCRV